MPRFSIGSLGLLTKFHCDWRTIYKQDHYKQFIIEDQICFHYIQLELLYNLIEQEKKIVDGRDINSLQLALFFFSFPPKFICLFRTLSLLAVKYLRSIIYIICGTRRLFIKCTVFVKLGNLNFSFRIICFLLYQS